MCVLNHKVKIIQHLVIGHHNWIEDATVKEEIKSAKQLVQKVLKPGQCPGGSRDDNIGKFYNILALHSILIFLKR